MDSTILKPPFYWENVKFCNTGLVLNYHDEARTFHLIRFNSTISGEGLKVAHGKIPKGWPVLRYTGPILNNERMHTKWKRSTAGTKSPRVEFFYLDENRTIDGSLALASYVNHSCEPNLRVHTDPVRGAVAFYSFREVETGEELTIDYSLGGGGVMYPCLCKTASCRGFMNCPHEVQAHLTAERYPAK